MKSKTIHGVRTGNHSNPNVLKAARRAAGGAVRGHQTTDDGRGGWAPKDGTTRPNGKPFAKGGRTKGGC